MRHRPRRRRPRPRVQASCSTARSPGWPPSDIAAPGRRTASPATAPACCSRSRRRSPGLRRRSRDVLPAGALATGAGRGSVSPRRARAARAGARCPCEPSALGTTSIASLPRIEQLLLAPCDGRRRPSCARYRARRRAEPVPGVYVASLSFRTVTYKALCAADAARGVLPRPERAGARRRVGDLPPALLDQHRAELGAGAAVPPALPQRRDQHDRGQRRLDGGARAGPRRRRRARLRARSRTARTRRCSTTRSSCSCGAGATSARR